MQFRKLFKCKRIGCSNFRYRYCFIFVFLVTVVILGLTYVYTEEFELTTKYTAIIPQIDQDKTSVALDDLRSRPVLKECEELTNERAAAINEVLSYRRKKFLEDEKYLKERFVSIAEEKSIEPGGVWKPKDCIPQHQLVMVIPYRNRTEQMTYFMPYIHEFLQYQKISYRIIIAEQSEEKKFNRGKLMNVGYAEALKLDSTQPCFLFHDVDLIPENVLNKFYCYDEPLHLTWCLDYNNYTLPWDDIFGGGVTMLASQFKLINGFSNSFWGWGGEDDDLLNRVRSKNLNYTRHEGNIITRYSMLEHAEEEPSSIRHFVMWTRKFLSAADGLKNLNYTVLDYQLKPLYTWIKVRL